MEESRSVIRRRCARAALCGGAVSACVGAAGAAPLISIITGALCIVQALFCGAILARPPPPSSHRIGRAFRLFKINRIAGLILHSLCGFFISLSCLRLLGLTVTEVCHQSLDFCLKEDVLLLLFAGIFNGIYYYVRTYIFDDPLVTFPLIEQRKFITIKLSIWSALKKAVKNSFVPIIFTSMLYYWKGHLFRNAAMYIYDANLKDKPMDGIFSVLSLPLLLYVLLNSTLYLAIAYMIILFFEIHLTERIIFPIESTEIPTLAQELSGDVEILNKLAARDLLYLSRDDGERRKQIFSLSQPGGHPTNWKNLLKECLKVIDVFIKSVESMTNDIKVTEEVKTPLQYKLITSPEPFKQTTLRNLTLSPQSPLQHRRIVTEDEIKPFLDMIKDEFRSFINNLCKKPGISFFFGELTHMKIKHLAHRGQIIAKISQGLAHLAMISLNEDVYGVVQDDLARLITSLLQLKLALDKLTKSGIINKKNLKQDSTPVQMLTDLKSAIKRSIYKISISFKDYMHDIILDNEIKALLQPFLNMREG